MTTVEVEALCTGVVPAPPAWVFPAPRERGARGIAKLLRPGEPLLELPVVSFVVRHPDQGTVLVDTGVHPGAAASVRRDFGALASIAFRTLRVEGGAFDEQLRGRGIDPARVRQVVMTHLHGDHTGGMRLLPGAQFVVERAEWDAATARDAPLNGYATRHLPPAERVRQVDVARDGEPHGPFARTLDLFGDGSVRLIATPGHSAGHLAVLLRTAQRQVLLLGDAVYTVRSLTEEIVPFRTVDDDRFVASLREVKAFAAAEPQAAIVPSHDPDAWRSL